MTYVLKNIQTPGSHFVVDVSGKPNGWEAKMSKLQATTSWLNPTLKCGVLDHFVIDVPAGSSGL
jgi:hypothetical protein